MIVEKLRRTISRRNPGDKSLLASWGAIGSIVLSITAHASVVEFYNPDLDNYFITADPVEQAFVDTGAVGRWLRTGHAFETGGPNQVCRFYGNGAINPATGTFYGPNSHFYTADAAECALVKSQFVADAKSWKFESNDFLTTPAINGACPGGLVQVYRAYNNGFSQGIDSNHRITSDLVGLQQVVSQGWTNEGVVMCAPSVGRLVETESNDTSGLANSASFHRDIEGSLSDPGDADWFYFDVATANVFINVTFDISTLNSGIWNVSWYGPGMDIRSARNISPPSFSYNFQALEIGRHYLRVMPTAPSLFNGGMYVVRAFPTL